MTFFEGSVLLCVPFILWHAFVNHGTQSIYNMGKQEIFNSVLSFIEEETEVSRDMILSANKREEVVDARALLIYVLYDIGFYPSQIAVLTGICPRCIMPFIQNFNDRKESRRMLRIYFEKVRKKVRESED